jgi:hypothetical protein
VHWILAPAIQELQATGSESLRAIAAGLDERGIPAARGASGLRCRSADCWRRPAPLSTQAPPSPSRERQPAALSGAMRREAEEDRASQHQRLGLEHWTRRLVGGHSAQCLSAMTPMAMPRNNKKNAGIQFGSNGTTYLHPVPFPAQKWHKIQTEARANFWTICRSATKHAPI